MQIKAGTKITTYTGGGGGFEKAKERNISDVLNDVKNKYISINKAKDETAKNLQRIFKRQDFQ